MSDPLEDIRLPDRPRLEIGPGAARRLGELAAGLGGRRVLLVTDRGVAAAGHVDQALRDLRDRGLDVTVFDAVRENPTTDDVAAAVTVAGPAKPDLIVGFGGGSSMDTAKGCNFIHCGGGEMADYRGIGKANGKLLPMIAVPTTAGTGSECQSFALISDPATHQKMACGDARALPAVAVLDPLLTLTQPPAVAANTGVDALAHAVESAVTTRRNEASSAFSRRAFELAVTALPQVCDRGDRVEARALMQLAAALGGAAIEQSMLGAAHSAANPLTAHFDIVHGRAVGVMLPAVVRYNGLDPDARRIYADLAGSEPDAAPDVLATMIENLLLHAGLPIRLCDMGVGASDCPMLAREAAVQWTAQFNPRPVDEAAFEKLYREAL